uniref:Uncharacterized protein n=1 Tax=Helianthus annuus TaxID=4232 RepID=A0A251VK02_HELAN
MVNIRDSDGCRTGSQKLPAVDSLQMNMESNEKKYMLERRQMEPSIKDTTLLTTWAQNLANKQVYWRKMILSH